MASSSGLFYIVYIKNKNIGGRWTRQCMVVCYGMREKSMQVVGT